MQLILLGHKVAHLLIDSSEIQWLHVTTSVQAWEAIKE